MPTRAPRACPRCGNKIIGRRCATCAARWQAKQANRPDPYKTDTRWTRLSAAYRKQHPYCESDRHLRLPDHLRPRSEIVDHIDGLGLDGPRAYDWHNLQGLCRRCHARKTAQHDGGYGRPRTDPSDPARTSPMRSG